MTITIFVQICVVVAFMAALIMVCAWINEVQKKITATKEVCMLLNSRLDAWVDILNDFIEDDEEDYKALKSSIEAVHECGQNNFKRIDDNINALANTVEYEAKESLEKFGQVTDILNGMDKRYDELEMFIKTQDEKNLEVNAHIESISKCFTILDKSVSKMGSKLDEMVNKTCKNEDENLATK